MVKVSSGTGRLGCLVNPGVNPTQVGGSSKWANERRLSLMFLSNCEVMDLTEGTSFKV